MEKELYHGQKEKKEKETHQRFMVEERFDFAQETFPEQSNRPNICKAGTAKRCGKKESVQNGTSQVEEIPEVPRQSIIYKAVFLKTTGI